MGTGVLRMLQVNSRGHSIGKCVLSLLVVEVFESFSEEETGVKY
jgi:hypothetical protein